MQLTINRALGSFLHYILRHTTMKDSVWLDAVWWSSNESEKWIQKIWCQSLREHESVQYITYLLNFKIKEKKKKILIFSSYGNCLMKSDKSLRDGVVLYWEQTVPSVV